MDPPDIALNAPSVTISLLAQLGIFSKMALDLIIPLMEDLIMDEEIEASMEEDTEWIADFAQRHRLLKDTTPLQRGIIRQVLLVIDLSTAMLEKDLRPTRHLLTLRYVQDFISEFFEQNPIAQLGVIGMRDGLAIRISDMSGNPNDHITKVQELRAEEPKGQPSLQNALEMARAALFHAPAHTTREVLLIFGSLLSSDPGDIHTTITALVNAKITVRVIGLAAQVAICNTIVTRTNPSIPTTDTYAVALNEQHYRDLLMRFTTPPAISQAKTAEEEANKSSLLMMGFPSRIADQEPSFCACHSKPTSGGYLCSRCSSKVCSLPTQCPVCGLQLILSTHLARSYHHLFPLKNWVEVSWPRAEASTQDACHACLTTFPIRSSASGHQEPSVNTNGQHAAMLLSTTRGNANARAQKAIPKPASSGVSESGRYECETCRSHFCIDCDVFSHEVSHNCPGCQSMEEEPQMEATTATEED